MASKKLIERIVYPSDFGKLLKVDQLKAMLSNSFYIGPFKYSGEVYQGSHKLFISKELFKSVQEKVHKYRKAKKKGT